MWHSAGGVAAGGRSADGGALMEGRELPKMFRSDRLGRLLKDKPVPLRWCDCGCGGPVSVDARPNACSVEDAGPPPNGATQAGGGLGDR